MLAAVLTAMALVFAQGVAFADSGTDISKWQGCVGSGQAATAKASGVNFGFVKVTEGNGYTDSVADCTMQSLKANGIRSPYVIYPGQKLSLGGANGNSAANTGRRSIVITAGDCLWNHFGADSARVAAANGISNPNLVRAGTVIHY